MKRDGRGERGRKIGGWGGRLVGTCQGSWDVCRFVLSSAREGVRGGTTEPGGSGENLEGDRRRRGSEAMRGQAFKLDINIRG